MTYRAQLLERRVQVAMANLAELGLEKIDIDEQIGQCVFVDLTHVASNERFLPNLLGQLHYRTQIQWQRSPSSNPPPV